MALGLGLLWAVLLSIPTGMVLGFLWYGPIFGKLWMKSIGWGHLSQEELKEKQKGAMPGYLASMVTIMLGVFLIGVLWDLAHGFGDTIPDVGIVDGLLLGAIGWAAFYLPGTFTSRFFEGTTFMTWILSAGYWFIIAVLSGLYVGIFV